MEKIVYFLGAGFSAPLGIPVMKNFFEKSKDMYFDDKEKYKHFLQVINTFNEYNLIKSFYESNLFNIEELLSILEMSERFERSKLKKIFLQYISDVISFYTPPLEYERKSLASVRASLEQSGKWNGYIMFIAALLNLEFNLETIMTSKGEALRLPRFYPSNDSKYEYGIISLNYDLVVEQCVNYLNNFKVDKNLSISRFPVSEKNPRGDLFLSKLHGSIDDQNIVPPTWNKSLKSDIKDYWNLASQLLKEANHIRFIGYSLPDSDAYVKYLLKSSITTEQHLKTIDVICYDPDGSVKKRYDQFIVFPNYNFVSEKTQAYLEKGLGSQKKYNRGGRDFEYWAYDNLETHHQRFIAAHS